LVECVGHIVLGAGTPEQWLRGTATPVARRTVRRDKGDSTDSDAIHYGNIRQT